MGFDRWDVLAFSIIVAVLVATVVVSVWAITIGWGLVPIGFISVCVIYAWAMIGEWGPGFCYVLCAFLIMLIVLQTSVILQDGPWLPWHDGFAAPPAGPQDPEPVHVPARPPPPLSKHTQHLSLIHI